MSDTLPPPPPAGTTPLPPPAETPPAELPPPVELEQGSAPAPAPLKPLLNPLQAEGSAPGSVIVEPPRSPNPANPATDDVGRNVLSPSAPASVIEPNGISPAPEVAAVEDQPPLPVDAPVPPSPKAADEPAPFLPASAIPTAVPTPSVITVEDPLAALAAAAPSPVPVSEANGPAAPVAAAPEFAPTPASAPVPSVEPASVAPFEHVAPPPTEQPAAPEPTPAPPAVVEPAPVAAPVVPTPLAEAPLPPSPVAPAVAASTPAVLTPSASLLSPAPVQPVAAPQPQVAASPLPAQLVASPLPTQAASPLPVGTPATPVATSPLPPVAPAPVAQLAAPAPAPVAPLAAPPAPVPIASPAAPPVGVPAPVKLEAAHPASDGMDLDADGEEEVPPPSLKRAGEELQGPDEKRIRENGAVAPATTVPLHYQPPAPKYGGPTTPLTTTQHKYLINAVRNLKKNKDAANFVAPVDYMAFNIPHYPDIVHNPMDLGTIETKLVVSNPRGPPKDKSKMGNWDTSKGRYKSVSEVTADVRQVWENTRMFNGPDHVVSQMASRLETIYEKVLASLPQEPPSAAPSPAGPSRPVPALRRSEDGDRPKREIHPPPPKELPEAPRKPKRRSDPQVAWAAKQVKHLESKYPEPISAFLYPVENLLIEVPDYSSVIKKPIDLNHIKARLAEGVYDNVADVNSDMRLMFNNAMKFNQAGHAVNNAAQLLMQAWNERWKQLPPKEVKREYSEDIAPEESVAEVEEDFEDDPTIMILREQIASALAKIDEIKANKRKSRPAAAAPKKASKPRKQSVSQPKRSPSVNGNGHAHVGSSGSAPAPAPKKPRKSKDTSYREDDGYESEEEAPMTMTQKQELAEKIQVADGDTLAKAIQIIQVNTGLGGSDEIELDIDQLPPKVVSQLYNLVCRGGAPRRTTAGRPKGQAAVVGGKKPGRKGTGGYNKRTMNEAEEAERIKRMEAQLQSFDRPAVQSYEEESSEEEESDDE